MRRLIPIVAAAGLASACTTGGAASVKREPLVVPAPPPRVIAPVPEPAPPPPPPPTEPEPVPPLPRASKTAPSRSESKPPEPSQPEASGAPPAPAAPSVAAPSEATELRTVEAPDGHRATRQVTDTLGRANATLGRVDYRNLSAQAKLQYDMAKRFIEQSEEALKARNYTAALLMAEKAETIAKELSGR